MQEPRKARAEEKTRRAIMFNGEPILDSVNKITNKTNQYPTPKYSQSYARTSIGHQSLYLTAPRSVMIWRAAGHPALGVVAHNAPGAAAAHIVEPASIVQAVAGCPIVHLAGALFQE